MDLGAPILDVSVSTSSSGGSASSSPAPSVSLVSGGTVTAPGYSPIVITKTVTNDPTMAAAAAAATTAAAAVQTTAAYSTSSTSTGAYVSTDRAGTNSYGVVTTNGGSNFAPNVQVVMNKNSNGQQKQSSNTAVVNQTSK